MKLKQTPVAAIVSLFPAYFKLFRFRVVSFVIHISATFLGKFNSIKKIGS